MTQVISQRETLPCVMVPTKDKKTGDCETGKLWTVKPETVKLGNWDCETGKLETVKLGL